MAFISKQNPVFTTVLRINCLPDDQEHILRLIRPVIPVFQDQPGFVSHAIHRSHDGREILIYVQWRTQEDHEACETNPQVLEASEEFFRFLDQSSVTLEIITYDVVAAYPE